MNCPSCGVAGPEGKRFCADCGAALFAPAFSASRSAGPFGAERRHVTVVFCDLVGSTTLSARLDPEDMSNVLAAFHSAAANAVRVDGGFVAQYLGDGVLAYFGYPSSRENDAECAIRAGLAVVQAVGRLATAAGTLEARIGIASGLVVVGAVAHVAEWSDAHAAIGDTPNLAARLQAEAAPGTVMIDAATRRQVGSLFVCEDLGSLSLKGIDVPVRVWRVRAEGRWQSRFEALRGQNVNNLVGRDRELHLLLRHWRRARAGAGQVVLVSGEAGIGKSRLVNALEARLRSETYTLMHFNCTPQHQGSAFHPVTAWIEAAARFKRDDAPEDKLRKLHAILEPSRLAPEDVTLIEGLLSFPGVPGASGDPRESPQQRKERTLDALFRQIAASTRRTPVMLLVEDAHWLDPSTSDLLDLLTSRVLPLPVLLVVTGRPEFRPRWLGRLGVSLLSLGRLEGSEAARIATTVAGLAGLSDGLLERIVKAADGVPLFLEELTKAVMEAGQASGVPGSLHASLMSRLDRLPAAKEVAQVGAVIGRTFGLSLLTAAARLPEATLRQGCDNLVEADLASRAGEGPHIAYTFKHALIQDTAYESLLRSQRSVIHARVAEALVVLDPGVEDARPELLGHHYAEAKLAGKAVLYFLRAGRRSAERSAVAEAVAHFERGLDLTRELPDGLDRQLQQAELHLALGNIYAATDGGGSPKHSAAFAAATELCRNLTTREPQQVRFIVRALHGDCSVKVHHGDMHAALSVAEDLLRIGRDQDDHDVKIFAAQTHGWVCFFVGHFAVARATFDEAQRFCGSGKATGDIVADFGQDPEVMFRAHFSRTLACMGYVNQTRQQVRLGIERAKALGHLPALAIALSAASSAAWISRDRAALREASGALLALSAERGFTFFSARAKAYVGWVASQDGDAERGRALIEEALQGLRDAGSNVFGPHTNAMLADAFIAAGRTDAAMAAVQSGLSIMARTGEKWIGAELHRRMAELLRLDSPRRAPVAAEASFLTAIELARCQSAKLFELRAASGLARLRLDQGRRADAHDVLAPIYGWFGEGSETDSLIEAGLLLGHAR